MSKEEKQDPYKLFAAKYKDDLKGKGQINDEDDDDEEISMPDDITAGEDLSSYHATESESSHNLTSSKVLKEKMSEVQKSKEETAMR
jgi:hypothetical protein